MVCCNRKHAHGSNLKLLKSRTIVLSGIDGSGKSAHALKLSQELKHQGKPVRYLWMRGYGRTLLSFPLLVLCRILKITEVRTLNNGIKVSLYRFYEHKPLRFLWPWVQLVDSLLFSIWLVYCPLLFSKDVIIMDRSVIDTLVDVIADTHAPIAFQSFQRFLLALLPKNSIVVIFDVCEEVAMVRKKDIFCVEYLTSRRGLYKRLAAGYGWKIAPTEEKFEIVHKIFASLIDQDS